VNYYPAYTSQWNPQATSICTKYWANLQEQSPPFGELFQPSMHAGLSGSFLLNLSCSHKPEWIHDWLCLFTDYFTPWQHDHGWDLSCP